MNDRIQQLALQARAWVNDTNNVAPDIEYVFYKDAYDKKFAELIIKECASVSLCIGSGDNETELLKHFGVEL